MGGLFDYYLMNIPCKRRKVLTKQDPKEDANSIEEELWECIKKFQAIKMKENRLEEIRRDLRESRRDTAI